MAAQEPPRLETAIGTTKIESGLKDWCEWLLAYYYVDFRQCIQLLNEPTEDRAKLREVSYLMCEWYWRNVCSSWDIRIGFWALVNIGCSNHRVDYSHAARNGLRTMLANVLDTFDPTSLDAFFTIYCAARVEVWQEDFVYLMQMLMLGYKPQFAVLKQDINDAIFYRLVTLSDEPEKEPVTLISGDMQIALRAWKALYDEGPENPPALAQFASSRYKRLNCEIGPEGLIRRISNRVTYPMKEAERVDHMRIKRFARDIGFKFDPRTPTIIDWDTPITEIDKPY